jgi:DNA polymerase I-like protein with 3'-5' exonuclease and polymerase domains
MYEVDDLARKKILFFDAETTFVWLNDRTDPSPYLPDNYLVSAGYAINDGKIKYDIFRHTTGFVTSPIHAARQALQSAIDEADIIVAHNAKFDIAWLCEAGFRVAEKQIFCTQIFEYVLARGQKLSISLRESCIRRGAKLKSDIGKQYFDAGISPADWPISDLLDYGQDDVESLRDLFWRQIAVLNEPDNVGLKPTIQMSNEFCRELVDMERNGIAVDLEALDQIEKEFVAEREQLLTRIRVLTNKVMGDKPYSISSPQQLSQVVYSRAVVDKDAWRETFNIGTELRGSVKKPKRRPKMSAAAFVAAVRANTALVRKSKASQCLECQGRGWIQKVKADGSNHKRTNRCVPCSASGIIYTPTKEYAGYRLAPVDPTWVSDGGFVTDADTLRLLLPTTDDPDAIEFLKGVIRINALDTYIDSFVGGIKKFTINGIIHPAFNQCVTATGRLSSSHPNFQNLPRLHTFPIKRAIVSRWRDMGGLILDADFAQLEFRCAVFQSQDKRGIKDILDGVDVHAFTAATITAAGQPTDRQTAKSHTFKPTYGGTSGTPAEQAYYKAFLEKYSDLAKWHERLQDDAIKHKKIIIPSGREYAFPGAKRLPWGGSAYATQIKNYPVQGFATADLVSCAFIRVAIALRLANLRSLLINDVHDSLILDVYPGELGQVKDIVAQGMVGVVDDLYARYGVKFNVPVEAELKAGPTWLSVKTIMKAKHPGFTT